MNHDPERAADQARRLVEQMSRREVESLRDSLHALVDGGGESEDHQPELVAILALCGLVHALLGAEIESEIESDEGEADEQW